MIEIRNLERKTRIAHPGGMVQILYNFVLQYRQTINDNEPCSDRLWSDWIDVPEIQDSEENQ